MAFDEAFEQYGMLMSPRDLPPLPALSKGMNKPLFKACLLRANHSDSQSSTDCTSLMDRLALCVGSGALNPKTGMRQSLCNQDSPPSHWRLERVRQGHIHQHKNKNLIRTTGEAATLL